MTVRFNLGRGKNYRKWKIQDSSGNVEYISPDDFQLQLHYGVLCNQRKHADKIYSGEHKRVCSWINTKQVTKHENGTVDVSGLSELKYNPRTVPYWTDESGNDLDDSTYTRLVTNGNKVYILKRIYE